MLNRISGTSLAVFSLLGAFLPFNPSVSAQSVPFTCQMDNSGIPTTYAETPDGYVPVFKWTSNYFQPPYTPERRCQEVSDRMNRFASAGALDYLTSGTINRQPVICAGSRCTGSNVVVTLKPGQNASQVLQELESNRSGAGGPSFQLNASPTSRTSSRPSAISRNVDGTVTLDLNRYLKNTPAVNLNNEVEPSNTSPEMVNPSNPSPGMVKPSNTTPQTPSSPRRW